MRDNIVKAQFLKSILGSLVAIFVVVAFFAPLSGAEAQVCKDPNVFSLAPDCGCLTGSGNSQVYHPCEYCHLFQVVENIINFIVFYLSIPLAAVAFAIAGFIYITSGGNSGKVSQAHSIFRNVAVGLIIILISWTLVDVVMKSLVSGTFYATETDSSGQNYFPWANVECIQGTQSINSTPIPDPGPNPTGSSLNRGQVESQLAGEGISVNKGECPPNTRYQDVNGGCTSLSGMHQSTIDAMIALKQDCDGDTGAICTFVVTGGTELGHSSGQYSHENGYKFDLRTDGVVDSYFADELVASGYVGSDAEIQDDTRYGPLPGPDGSQIYVRYEGTGTIDEHIDVQVIPSGSEQVDVF